MKEFYIFCFFVLLFSHQTFARFPNRVTTEGPVRYFEFLFLYDSYKTPEQKEYHLHPFYSNYSHTLKAYYFETFLYPVYYRHGTNYWKTWSFLFLFNGDEKYDRREKSEWEIALTPLFFFGYGDNPNEKFFSFFPIGGKIKDKLSWSEISYILFPLYVSWNYKSYRAYSIIWPILMWGGDNHKRKDFRFFPFYSSKVHKGKYNHKTLLWPFFQWGSDDLDKKDPRHFFMFFPLYAQKKSESGSMYSYSILYPFPLIAFGKDEKQKSFDFKFLWILFQYSKSESPYIRRWMFFPFYLYYRFGNSEIQYYQEANFYFLLLGNLKTQSALMQTSYDFFYPFWSQSRRYYVQEQVKIQSWKLWPVIQYWEEENSYGIRTLALWPLPDDFFERNWGTYYSLFEYKKLENHDKYISFLFRIFSVRWNQEYKDLNLFFAGIQYHNSPYLKEFHLFGGLLGYSYEVVSEDGVSLYDYPRLAMLLDDSQKKAKHYFHFLWFRI